MRIKVVLSVLSCFVLLALIIAPLQLAWAAEAQPAELWEKTFSQGYGEETAYSAKQTTDGGYIMAGYAAIQFGGEQGALLIKTDASGNETWRKTFAGGSDGQARSVQQTADGGYIMAGYTDAYGLGDQAWLIKTDAGGNETWDRNFGVAGFDRAYSVQQTTDGGYIMAGLKAPGPVYAWLIKTDPSGYEMWDTSYRSTTVANSVQQTRDGGYILAGYKASSGNSKDAWIAKTNSTGMPTWEKTFGGANEDYAASVQQTSDRGYILAGATTPNGSSYHFAWLIKTNSLGNKRWETIFGGTGDYQATSVQETSHLGDSRRGYILTGFKDSGAWLIKTNLIGTETWEKTFGGAVANSVQQTRDGGYILAGFTASYTPWLTKVSFLPTITSITPNSGTRAGVISARLYGTNFQSGATVKLTRTGQPDIYGFNVVTLKSSRVITCAFALANAAVGSWNVVVKNPDGGTGTLWSKFIINNP